MLKITDFNSQFPDAESRFSDLLNTVVDAHDKKNPWLLKTRIIRCLNSHSARLISVEQAVRQMQLTVTNSDIEAIAQKLNPWAGSSEPAKVSARRKGDPGAGDYRLTFDFGLENRALQYLIKAILLAVADLHPHQYGTVGTRAAIAHVAELMSQGYVYAVELDIVKCFPSFKEEGLHKLLLLPKRVVRHVAMASHLNVVSGNLHDLIGPAKKGKDPIAVSDFLAEARQGIPQGSAASSIVAEILLAPLYKALPDVGLAVGYVDNIFLLAKTEEDLLTITKAFWRASEAHSVGLLRPTLKSGSGPCDPKDFLGHRLKLIHGNVKITPSPENDAIFEGEMKKGIGRLRNPKLLPKDRQKRANDLRRYVKSWTANFALCDGIADRRALWLSKIQGACKTDHKYVLATK